MKREEEHESKAKVKTGMKERYKQKQETKRDGQKVRETGRQWHTLNLRWLSRRGNLKLFSRQKKARRKRIDIIGTAGHFFTEQEALH